MMVAAISGAAESDDGCFAMLHPGTGRRMQESIGEIKNNVNLVVNFFLQSPKRRFNVGHDQTLEPTPHETNSLLPIGD